VQTNPGTFTIDLKVLDFVKNLDISGARTEVLELE
jgi:hypothetical protein